MPVDRLGDVLRQVDDVLSGAVTTSEPHSTWAGGDADIPLRVLLDPFLSDADKVVYGFLNRLRKMTRGSDPFASEDYMAAHLRTSIRSVQRSISKLRHRGWVLVFPRAKGRFNRYVLVEVVPAAAWPSVMAGELALRRWHISFEATKVAGHDTTKMAGRTTTVRERSTRALVPLLRGTVFSDVPYEQIEKLRELKKLPRSIRVKYLEAFKSIVQRVRDKRQLEELLVYAGTWTSTAKLLCDSFSLVRIRGASQHIPLNCNNIGAWLRTALEKGYKFPG